MLYSNLRDRPLEIMLQSYINLICKNKNEFNVSVYFLKKMNSLLNMFINTHDDEYDNYEEDDNDNKVINDLEMYFEKNIVPINGNGVEYSTWFTKLIPCGIDFIKPWGLNRQVDNSFIENIVKKQEEFYIINKRYNFIDCLHLSKDLNNNYQLLDGQHRLCAYQKLYHKNDRPRIPVIIHLVKDENEKMELFKIINNRAFMKLDELYLEKLNELKNKMNSHWLGIYTERKKRNGYGYNFKTVFGNVRPYIDENKFCRMIRETDTFKEKSVDKIMDILININDNIKHTDKSKRGKGISKISHDKCDCFSFYLGCDKDMIWMKGI